MQLAIKDDTDFDTFNKHFIQVLDKYAPIKQKTVRANNQPYMTKALRKAMMKRTELANKYHKHRKDEDYTKFRKQRNYVNRLYKKERRNYFNNLQKNDLEDIKSFWKTVKPLISDKCRTNNNIKIAKDGCIIENNQEMAEEFNSKFANVVSDLNISFNWNTDPEI
jgi:predicted transport protein